MSEKKTGGPAFPFQHNPVVSITCQGMTLSDYFAAEAMQSLLRNDLGSYETVVQRSYAIADMMLKEREK